MFARGRHAAAQHDRGWQWDPAFDSTVTFNDNTVLDDVDPFESTAGIKAVDLSCRTLAPKLIARSANVTYMASHRGTGIVYRVDTGAAPGLHVARVF